MALKRTTYDDARRERDNLARALDDVLRSHKSSAYMKDHVKALEDLKTKIAGHDLEHMKHPSVELEGKTLMRGEIRPKLSLTGYGRWRSNGIISGPDTDVADDIEHIESTFGVKLKPRQVRRFGYSRPFESRSELFYMEFLCIPGHFQIDYGSDRVSTNTEWFENDKLDQVLTDIGEEFPKPDY